MAVKKPRESDEVSEVANDWYRQFLKMLELAILETGLRLPPDATHADFRLAALRAVKLTLLDSGIDEDAVTVLFGQVAFEDVKSPTKRVWNAELNKRRFELIDGDIQGTLNRAEQLELSDLTQLMREYRSPSRYCPMVSLQAIFPMRSGSSGNLT